MSDALVDGLDRGIHRLHSAEETVAHVLARLRGYDTALIEDYEKISIPSGIPQYRVYGAPAFCTLVGRRCAFGKGHTWDQALASGLMEVVERYSCFSYLLRRDGAVRAAARDLDGDRVSLDELLAIPLEKPDRLLAAAEIDRMPLNWFPATGLDGSRVMVPESVNRHLAQNTNGMAAGNSLDEALVQALCEVVERHCWAQVVFHRLRTPVIDRDTIESPTLQGLIERFESLGQRVYVKDFSLDTGLPVTGVVRVLRDASVQTTIGVAPWRDEALARTLTENAQMEGQSIFGTRDEMNYMLEGDDARSFADLPSLEGGTHRDEIDRFAERFAVLGWRAVYQEATHPSLDIPTVIADVIGTRHRYYIHRTRSDITAVLADGLAARDYDAVAGMIAVGRERDPGRSGWYGYYSGELEMRRGNLERAIEEFASVVEMCSDGDDDEAQTLTLRGAGRIARCYRELGDDGKAIEWIVSVLPPDRMRPSRV